MKARVKNLLGAAALLAWLTAGVIATADVVIDDSLIARYNFDAAPVGDVIVDSSPGGSNHPGTNLEATWTALVVDGTGNSRTGAMDFDSVLGSQITVAGHDDFDFPERGTISFWMKSAGIGSGDGHPDYSMLFDRRTTTGFVFSQFGDGRLFKQSGGDVWGTTNISDDNWHHVALVYSRLAGESNYVYVDAAEDGTSVTPGDWVWPVGQQLEIGRSHDPFWKRYDGLIDDFRIYNRALTPEEITLISEGDLPELTWDGANSTWDSGAGANSHWDGGPTVGALPDADARAIVATGICAVNNAREAWSLAIEGNGVVNIAAPSGQLTVGTVVNVGPGAALNLAGTLQTAVLGTGGLNVSPGASLIVTTFFDLQSDLNMTGSTLTLNGARVTVPDGTTLTYDRPVALGSLALDGNLALTAADPADRKVAVSGGTMAVGSPALLTNGLSEVVLEDATFRIKGSIHIGATPPMPAIPGLRLHLDAGDVNGDGSPLFDGERVFTWVDKSGNGNDAMAQGEPTYIAGVPQANGQSVVRFDGSDDEYFDLPSIDDVRTAFLVLEKDADASGLKFHLGGISTHDFHPGDFNEVWHGTWAHENILTGTTIVDGFEIDGPAAQIPYDFSVLSVVTTGNVQTNRLGRDRDGFVGRNWQGDMAEIILSNEALSDAAVADVTFYLQQKYGLGPIEAIAMADTDFTVTGTSTIDAVTPRTAQFGSLTLGGMVTLSGAAGGITFTGGTNIPVGTTGEVGVNLQVPTDLGGISGSGAEVVFAKSGPVELVIDSDVDSGLGMATLDVRQGELIALGGATPLDVAGLQISGGDLTLAAKARSGDLQRSSRRDCRRTAGSQCGRRRSGRRGGHAGQLRQRRDLERRRDPYSGDLRRLLAERCRPGQRQRRDRRWPRGRDLLRQRQQRRQLGDHRRYGRHRWY